MFRVFSAVFLWFSRVFTGVERGKKSLVFWVVFLGFYLNTKEWKIRAGSICHFAFSLVLQRFGVPKYPDAGKNRTKSVTVTPLFVCPKC